MSVFVSRCLSAFLVAIALSVAVILSDLKMGLISRSLSDCPGIIPLMTNLCGSIYPDVPSTVLRQKFSPQELCHIEAYIRGASHALYSFGVPQCMLGLTFEVSGSAALAAGYGTSNSWDCWYGELGLLCWVLQEVATNLFDMAGIITVGIQRKQDSLLQSECLRRASRTIDSYRVPRGPLDDPQASPALSGASTSQRPVRASKPFLSADASAKTGMASYWLNPCGKNCFLRPGDRLVIIAASVAVAECLQYATRMPWGDSTNRVRTLVSHIYNARENLFSRSSRLSTCNSLHLFGDSRHTRRSCTDNFGSKSIVQKTRDTDADSGAPLKSDQVSLQMEIGLTKVADSRGSGVFSILFKHRERCKVTTFTLAA